MSSSRPPRQRREPTNSSRPVWPWIVALVLTAVGLATSIELELVHVNAWTGAGAKSFCAINAEFNCDTVARSPFSVFLGVPIAIWGIVGYVLMAAVALWGWLSHTPRAAVASLAALSFFSVAVSAVLGIISKLTIQSVCVLCLATYALNAGLAVISVLLLRRAGVRRSIDALRSFLNRNLRNAMPYALIGGVGLLALIWLHPRYWDFSQGGGPHSQRDKLTLPAPPPSGSAGCSDRDVATGVTDDGHPWIGARDPKLTIVEFSDYECPFCARGHQKLRALVEANPRDLRLVHKNFPLDHSCNPVMKEPLHARACFYAGLAACAGEQGKFWAVNDFLFIHGHDESVEAPRVAKELGLELAALTDCLDKRAIGMIRPDIEEGIKLKIDGTPSYVVNGVFHPGEVPPEVLAPYVGR